VEHAGRGIEDVATENLRKQRGGRRAVWRTVAGVETAVGQKVLIGPEATPVRQQDPVLMAVFEREVRVVAVRGKITDTPERAQMLGHAARMAGSAPLHRHVEASERLLEHYIDHPRDCIRAVGCRSAVLQYVDPVDDV